MARLVNQTRNSNSQANVTQHLEHWRMPLSDKAHPVFPILFWKGDGCLLDAVLISRVHSLASAKSWNFEGGNNLFYFIQKSKFCTEKLLGSYTFDGWTVCKSWKKKRHSFLPLILFSVLTLVFVKFWDLSCQDSKNKVGIPNKTFHTIWQRLRPFGQMVEVSHMGLWEQTTSAQAAPTEVMDSKIYPLALPKGTEKLCELCSKRAYLQCPKCRVTFYWWESAAFAC